MPKKVSPEYFIQLSQRVNIVHKGKGKIYWTQVKGTGNLYINDYCIVLKVQVKRTGRHIIRAQVKGTKGNYKPRSKTGLLIFYMYTNQPRSTDRAHNLKKPVI